MRSRARSAVLWREMRSAVEANCYNGSGVAIWVLSCSRVGINGEQGKTCHRWGHSGGLGIGASWQIVCGAFVVWTHGQVQGRVREQHWSLRCGLHSWMWKQQAVRGGCQLCCHNQGLGGEPRHLCVSTPVPQFGWEGSRVGGQSHHCPSPTCWVEHLKWRMHQGWVIRRTGSWGRDPCWGGIQGDCCHLSSRMGTHRGCGVDPGFQCHEGSSHRSTRLAH